MDGDVLRYPIGPFRYQEPLGEEARLSRIQELADLPKALRRLLRGRGQQDWMRTYRPGGWTVAQLVHHLADSHGNAFFRFKLALTADRPVVAPFDEALWAELPDARELDPEVSLRLLEAVHERWVYLLRAMKAEDFARTYWHPLQKRAVALQEALALYAWHGRHHLAHIRLALEA